MRHCIRSILETSYSLWASVSLSVEDWGCKDDLKGPYLVYEFTNLENSAVATGLEKVSFHSNPKNFIHSKKCSNYHTVVLISHASKVMLKILQVRLQQYVNREVSDIQAGFRKCRVTRYQIDPTSCWIIEKPR